MGTGASPCLELGLRKFRMRRTTGQGLTLVPISAQLEPCLTHRKILHSRNTPYHPLNTGYTTPTRTPYPQTSLKLS
jgi:hypothetical protein